MKKLISALLSLIIVATTAVMPAMAKDNIKVTLNGQEIKFDVQPQLINERTMVPVRAIFEALGASVDWDQATQTVTSKKGDITISLGINNPVMIVNDKKVDLDQPACIIDERTLVPVRAISEAYGTTVDWDQAAKTVVIKTSDYVETPVIHYDDITANVNQIKDMISRGLYVEAMQECENAKNWHNLSPDDIALVDSLYKTAKTKYNKYLENSKPVYTASAFDSLKNSIMTKGTYKSKYSKYSIDYYYKDSLTSLDYKPSEDKINISCLSKLSNGSAFVSLTIKRNQNTTGGVILEVSSSEKTVLFEYKNGKRVITYNQFPSSLSSSLNSMLNTSMSLFDTMLKIYTNVTLSDFGVYY